MTKVTRKEFYTAVVESNVEDTFKEYAQDQLDKIAVKVLEREAATADQYLKMARAVESLPREFLPKQLADASGMSVAMSTRMFKDRFIGNGFHKYVVGRQTVYVNESKPEA